LGRVAEVDFPRITDRLFPVLRNPPGERTIGRLHLVVRTDIDHDGCRTTWQRGWLDIPSRGEVAWRGETDLDVKIAWAVAVKASEWRSRRRDPLRVQCVRDGGNGTPDECSELSDRKSPAYDGRSVSG
jgi:hypothetical protein